MCGIVGFWNRGTGPEAASEAVLHRMAERIRHRGPDSYGSWHDAPAGISLGHRRLSIVDLTETGHQPMVSHNGRFVITFNGEIYNHRDIRERLDRKSAGMIAWRGSSDTETLLEAISRLGLGQTLDLADGMFALGLWDRELRQLTLARDPFGEKPLYYGEMGGALVFGSELKALRRYPGWRGDIDPSVVDDFLRFGFIADPRSIFAGISKVPCGSFIRLSDAGRTRETVRYWNAVSAANEARADLVTDWEEAVDRTSAAFSLSVARRLQADVDAGVFLSGGVDSSLTAAVAQQVSSAAVNTFTIGFEDPRYDESPAATCLAEVLGTRHQVFHVSNRDALDMVERLGTVWDEPFADPSQIPTLLLCRETAQHVRVALSGDGGDELFCGYNRHIFGPKLSVPPCDPVGTSARVRPVMARFLRDVALRNAAAFAGNRSGMQHKLQRIDRALAVVGAGTSSQAYQALLDMGAGRNELARRARATTAGFADDLAEISGGIGFREYLMLADTLVYLPGDILTKVDRAAMASGLETRTPFLSRNLFELAWKLPEKFKVQGKSGKIMLRELLKRKVPAIPPEPAKKGFSAPLGEWFRGPLAGLTRDLSSGSGVADCGPLDLGMMRSTYDKVRAGSVIHERMMWHALVLQLWLQTWKDES